MTGRTGHRVFLTNLGTYDYSLAKQWGEIVTLTTGRIDLSKLDNVRTQIYQILEAAATGEDYLLLAGHPIVCIYAAAFMLGKFGRLNLLIWNGLRGEYECQITTGSPEIDSVSSVHSDT